MDDLSVSQHDLERGLREIRRINWLLGAYGVTRRFITAVAAGRLHLSVLDVGTGAGDHLEKTAMQCRRLGVELRATGVDRHPETVRLARRNLDRGLALELRDSVDVIVGDALQLPFADKSFDVVTASLTLHHFDEAECAVVLREMGRVARDAIMVFDLHRHMLALIGILLITRLLPFGRVVRADAPRSVRRGFSRQELSEAANEAGLVDISLRWTWPFKWVLRARAGDGA